MVELEPEGGLVVGAAVSWSQLWESGGGCLPKHELSLWAEGLAKGHAWTDGPTLLPYGTGRACVRPQSCDTQAAAGPRRQLEEVSYQEGA